MKTFGGKGKIKFGALDIFPNAKAPAWNFFQNNDQQDFWHYKIFGITYYSTSFGRLPRPADTVQCPVQTKQKMQNITPFATMVEWPTVGVLGLE